MKIILSLFLICVLNNLLAQDTLVKTTDTTAIDYFYKPQFKYYKGAIYQNDVKLNKTSIENLIINTTNYKKAKQLDNCRLKIGNNRFGKYFFGGISMIYFSTSTYFLISSSRYLEVGGVLSGMVYLAGGGMFLGFSELCRKKQHKKQKQFVELYNHF